MDGNVKEAKVLWIGVCTHALVRVGACVYCDLWVGG